MQGTVPIPWGSPQYWVQKGDKKERAGPYDGKGGKNAKDDGHKLDPALQSSLEEWNEAAEMGWEASQCEAMAGCGASAGSGSCGKKGGAKGFLAFLDNSYRSGLSKGAWQGGGVVNNGYGGGLNGNGMGNGCSGLDLQSSPSPPSDAGSFGGLNPKMKLGDALNFNGGVSGAHGVNGTPAVPSAPVPLPEDPEQTYFVEHVKKIQRNSQKDREMWWNFCEAKHSGTRDPKLHSKEFLQEFITAHSAGTLPAPSIAAGGVLRLRGVPFSCSNLDIAQFLVDYGVDPDSVVMNVGLDGRLTGEAFVSFPSLPMAERALTEKQRATMGTRYIELFRASHDEWTQSFDRAARSGNAVPNAPHRRMAQEFNRRLDPVKEMRVERVKAIQQMGDVQQQLWYNFCRARGMADYDPAKHNAEFLDQFLSTYDAHCAQTMTM